MAIKEQVMRLRAEGYKEAERDLRSLASTSNTLNSELSNLAGGAAMGLTAVAGALGAVGFAVKEAAHIADLGDQFLDLRNQFDNLSTAAGHTSDVLLNQLQNATDNAISNADLFRVANKAMTLDLEKSGVSFVELADKVKDFADATGKDAKTTMDAFVQAMGTGRVTMLASQGVFVDATTAIEDYATSIGKSVSDLTEQEKAIAKNQASMDALREAVGRLGDTEENAGDAAQTLNAQMENAFDNFRAGFASSEELRDSLAGIADIIRNTDWESYGKSVADALGTAMDYVNDFYRGLERIKNAWNDMPSGDVYQQIGGLESRRDAIKPKEAPFSGRVTGFTGYQREEIEGINHNLEELYARRDALVNQDIKELFEGESVAIEHQNRAIVTTNTHLAKTTNNAEKLRREFDQIAERDTFADLNNDLKHAMDELDRKSFEELKTRLKTKLEEAIEEGLVEKFGQAISSSEIDSEMERQVTRQMQILDEQYDEVRERKEQKDAEAARRQADKMQTEMERAYDKSVSFWESIFIGAVEGNIEDVFKNMMTRMVAQYASQMMASMSTSFGGMINSYFGGGAGGMGGAGGGMGGASGWGMTAAAGSGAAGYMSGSGTVSTVAGIGTALYLSYDDYHRARQTGSDQDVNTAIHTGTAAIAAGIFTGGTMSGVGAAAGHYVGQRDSITRETLGWARENIPGTETLLQIAGVGYPDPDRQWRSTMRDRAQELGMVGEDTSFDIFGAGRGTLSPGGQNYYTEGKLTGSPTSMLGNVLSVATIGEIDEQLSAMWANALDGAGTFNEQLLTTQDLLEKAGLNAESAGNLMIEAFLEGNISLDELNQNMDMLSRLSIDSFATMAEGTELFADSLEGRPRDSIRALEIAFNTARETGIQDTEAMAAAFEQNLGEDAGNVIRELAANGIDLFTDFSELSQQQIVFLINQIEGLGGALDITREAAEESGKALRNEMSSSVAHVKSLTSAVGGLESKWRSAANARREYAASAPGPGEGTSHGDDNAARVGGGTDHRDPNRSWG